MIRLLRSVRVRAVNAASTVCILFAVHLYLPEQTLSGTDRVDPVAATAAQSTYTPITGTERATQFLKDTANPLSLVTSAASAGLGQWNDRPHEWRQGGEGYGLRYGSSYAEHIVRESLKFGAAAAFHEDDRYFRSEGAGVGTRIGHAVGSTFVAGADNGTRRFSISRIGAFAGAALISRLWQPRSTNNLRSAGVNFGTSIGIAMVSTLPASSGHSSDANLLMLTSSSPVARLHVPRPACGWTCYLAPDSRSSICRIGLAGAAVPCGLHSVESGMAAKLKGGAVGCASLLTPQITDDMN